MYCSVLVIEIICVYFLWPETKGRTLEELTFRKLILRLSGIHSLHMTVADCLPIVFESDELKQKQTIVAEKQLFGGDANSIANEMPKADAATTETHEVKA